MRRSILLIGLLPLSLGNLLAQQIPLQTFISAGGATGSTFPSTSVPTHFSSIGQPFVLARPVSTSHGGGVMTANEFMFGTTTSVAPSPTAQPTVLLFTSVASSSLTVSFTAATGSPNGYIVIRKSGAAPVSVPSTGTSYNAGDPDGDATVAYVGTATTFNDTGLIAGTTYYYAVFSFNGTGATTNYLTTSPLTGNQTTSSVVDTTPPQITVKSITPTSVALNSIVTVSVTVVDTESTVNNVTISYGPTNSATVTAQNVDMTHTSGNDWQFSVPGASVTELGLTYSILATSGGGSSTPVSGSVAIAYSGTGLTIPYSSAGSDVSNYRIVAVPLNLTAKTVNDVFGDDLGSLDKTKWRMYRYDNGATNELSGAISIDAGKGYWLIVKSGGTAINTGAGTTVSTSSSAPFQIDLKADWNEIGNPYNFNLSWADVQAANPGLPGLRKYNGDFIDGTRLDALEGGFVKLTAAQKLTFPVVKNASVNGRAMEESPHHFKNSIDEPNWQVYFTLQQGNLFNRISGFGMNEGSSIGFDLLDGFTMPRFLEPFLEVNHDKKEGFDHYSSDIVPSSTSHVWKFSIESSLDERRMLLTWDNSYFGNNDRELFLWDEGLQQGLDMRKFDRYEFDKNSSTSFKVVYGSMDFVKTELSLKNLVLHGVFPNPAEGDVTIAFTTPETTSDRPVSFEAFDIMGRKVWTHEVAVSSGYHELIWRRASLEAQGVYVVQVKSGVETRQKRIVLK